MRKRPSLNEIDAVLRQELAPEFAGLERERRWVQLSYGISGVLLLPLVLALFTHIDDSPAILGLVVGLVGLAGYFVRRAQKRFSSAFKQKVMTKVAARFFPSLAYRPDGFVDKRFYDDSGLFRESLDLYSGNDHFSGQLGEVDFQFSELLCQYETGSGKNRRTVTAFRGFFFVGDFHRDFYFRTQIRPDLAESLFGVLGRGLQRMGNGSRLVDLEDQEFEQMFVVTGDDQVEARYILTPVFMEKVKEFRKRVGNDIHLSFVNGKMLLAIETSHDYFEPSVWGEILSRQDLMKFIDMLILLVGVADEFLRHPKFQVSGAAGVPRMPHPALPNLSKMPPLPKMGRR